MTILAPVDIEALGVSALDASTKVPNPRPAAFVTVENGGGEQINVVQSRPRLIVQAWAATSEAAFDLAAEKWAIVNEWPGTYVGDVWVSEVNLTLPVYFEDPATKSPRYQFVAQLTASLRRLP